MMVSIVYLAIPRKNLIQALISLLHIQSEHKKIERDEYLNT